MAAAHGLDKEFEFDSAGLESYHVGDPPDRRSRERAGLRGYDLSALRARRFDAADFETFDLILAMDREHFDGLLRRCPNAHVGKVKMFADAEVPDPYYGKTSDFDLVLDMCESAVPGLLGVKS